MWPDYQTFSDDDTAIASAYLSCFRPLRMLREVAAKRRVLSLHNSCGTGIGYCDDGGHGLKDADGRPLGCADLFELAGAWSGHPDYRAEWG